MTKFRRILEANESVLWEGKPELFPYILDKSVPYFFAGVIWMILIRYFVMTDGQALGLLNNSLFLLLPHLFIGIVMMIGPVVYSIASCRATSYLATDRRILIRSGLLGEDFESIEYDEIAQTKVDVGLRDVLLTGSSGNIHLHGKYRHAHQSAGQFVYTLWHVRDPYEVFKMIEKISRDFKTEMKYPNKYRPKKNKGYKTKYKEGAAIET